MSLLLSFAQNIVNRVASLPFISSAYNLVSSAYSYTKGIHPYISNICSVAETVGGCGIRITGGFKSRLDKPLSGLVKVYLVLHLRRGLDLMTSRGPFQPYDSISSHTKAAGQLVASGVDAVLEKSQALVDHYLPLTNEELVKLAIAIEGFNMASVEEQKQRQSYFVRLGSLSNKVRHRAYQHSLNKLRLIKQNTQDSLSQLQLAINLVSTPPFPPWRLEKLQQLWIEWSRTQPSGSPAKDASQPEVSLVGSTYRDGWCTKHCIQGLPSDIQETVQQAVNNVQQLHASFSRADSFQDLSSSSLTQSQEKMTKAQESLDALLEYISHNTPLNWLVGPFSPSVRATQEATEDFHGKNRTSLSVLVTHIPARPIKGVIASLHLPLTHYPMLRAKHTVSSSSCILQETH
uniref:Perilipin n=1 Tax=Terrapene triunguis TaxID=2587831 RepID=A0A674KHL0_9SAUR